MKRLALLLSLTVIGHPVVAQDVAQGAQLYYLHCAACHGEQGRGDGPMRNALTQEPADLTQLAASNKGVFPMGGVIARIDGRDPLLAHGGAMPVYGYFFEGEPAQLTTRNGPAIRTTIPVASLVVWLQSIQTP